MERFRLLGGLAVALVVVMVLASALGLAATVFLGPGDPQTVDSILVSLGLVGGVVALGSLLGWRYAPVRDNPYW